MVIKSFEDLEVWQLSRKLVVNIYDLTKDFPDSEKFGLTSQTRSAAVSIAANIAEGFGRYHLKDNIKFLYNARGSLLEVKSHLLIAKEIGLIKDKDLHKLLAEIRNLGVKLNNFINSLKKKL
jgi:four helix bundle protein